MAVYLPVLTAVIALFVTDNTVPKVFRLAWTLIGLLIVIFLSLVKKRVMITIRLLINEL